jgi:hypothetical protein
MRKVAPALLLIAAACGTGDNVVVGGFGESSVTPLIQFDNIRSVISGRAHLFDTSPTPQPTGESEVIIISDRPQLCDRLKANRDYFRHPPEPYLALILFLPPTNHLGTFMPGRAGDEGTDSEIIAIKDVTKVYPFKALKGGGYYISLRDWSEQPGGEANGSFNLAYVVPPEITTASVAFQLYGKFKANVCPGLDGTLLP